MKKILALVMVLAMMLSSAAFADKIEYGTENTLVLATEVAYEAEAADVDVLGNAVDGGKVPTGLAHVTSWGGKYVLVAAYISEYCIDEYDVEDVEAGFYAVPENTVYLELTPMYDASANDPSGPLVDQGNYWHAHCYDLAGSLTLSEDIDEDGYKVSAVFDQWKNEVRGNADGDFNFGPTKAVIKGEDDYIYWGELTGLEIEAVEEEELDGFEFIGMNLDGQILVMASDKNVATKGADEITLVYVFDKVVEEAAE